jgi:4-amino-4-deoxy-L-arabinose transferase-like glycosyltransferase
MQLGVFATLALAYNFIFPPFEPTDEPAHYGYVRWLLDERRLPVARPDAATEFHQPPLYYALAALATAPVPVAPGEVGRYGAERVNPYRGYHYWEPGLDNKNLFLHGPWDGWPFQGLSLSVHLARLASLGLGLVTVFLSYQTARLFFSEPGALAVAGLVAFNPMFVAVSASLQNDAGAAALGTLAVWLGALGLRSGFTVRRAGALGLAVGLGALTKITAIFLLPGAVFAIAAWAWQQRLPWRRMVWLLTALLGAAVAGGGWWYARNQWLYGEPTALNVNFQAYGGRTVAEGLAVWHQALPYAWTTFWGRFGHGDVVLPAWFYWAMGALVVGAAAGWLGRIAHWGATSPDVEGTGLRRSAPGEVWRLRTPDLALLFLVIVGLGEIVGMLGYLTLSPSGYMGRYTFPALAAYAVLLVAGWRALLPERALAVGVPALFAGLSLWVWAGVLVPVYSPPPRIARLPASAHPLEANLSNVARLRGYALEPDAVRPGERLWVTLYWETLEPTALPFSVYVHVFDQEGVLVAQRDTFPGLGRYPSTAWQPGRLFADRYAVEVPATAYSPGELEVEAGLWQAQTGEHTFVLDASGQPVAADVALGALGLAARAGTTPNPIDLDFGGAWRLEGYSLSARKLAPGQRIDLTTYWDGQEAGPEAAFMFVHVTGADGRMWANQSLALAQGAQSLPLQLAGDTPPGTYDLYVGVFVDRAGEQVRLKLLADDGHEIDDRIRLTGLRLEP